MRIAFTHNLQTDGSELQAEFDSPTTVAQITEALCELGHLVEPINVDGTPSQLIARLAAFSPDLIFNTAEGHRGRFREAFYPGLFEQLGLPYTGSDAYTCAVTLDKHLSKLLVASRGIRVPEGILIERAEQTEVEPCPLTFPVILKPNFEGSSKGITQDSVVTSQEQYRVRALELLSRFPYGLLVERYIAGRDITVPFLGRVLEPCQYRFHKDQTYQLYDYELKQQQPDKVTVQIPAELTPAQLKIIQEAARVSLEVLGVVDFGRVDFRLGDDGELYFIEVNALPSLEFGASLYLAAARIGLTTPKAVLERLLELACTRQGVEPRVASTERPLTVGLAFNLKHADAETLKKDDREAEFDSPSTVQAIREAIEEQGFKVLDLEATPDFAAKVSGARVDLVFNVAEGLRGKNREAQVPSILELLDIPYTGSDPATLCLTLDKGLAKRIVSQAGVPTPAFCLMQSGQERLPKELRFPLIVKPLAEGSSKGVTLSSVVETEIALRAVVEDQVRRYRQPALVEQFVGGREFTVGVLGDQYLEVLPIMEIVFAQKEGNHAIYTFEHKLQDNDQVTFSCPASLEPELKATIEEQAKTVFRILGCRDVARIDFRMDDNGAVHFIECNPLPGLTPGFSDLCVIGARAGLSYTELIGRILEPALQRLREKA